MLVYIVSLLIRKLHVALSFQSTSEKAEFLWTQKIKIKWEALHLYSTCSTALTKELSWSSGVLMMVEMTKHQEAKFDFKHYCLLKWCRLLLPLLCSLIYTLLIHLNWSVSGDFCGLSLHKQFIGSFRHEHKKEILLPIRNDCKIPYYLKKITVS